MRTKLFSVLAAVLISVSAMAQSTARVQVIHNSADALASVVDIYVNGVLAVPDFEFRTATPFLSLPAGVNLTVAIAPGNSTSAAQAVATFTYNLTANETYVLVANGIVSSSGYSPATPFNIEVFAMGREEAAASGNTDVLVFHGATDAPTVSVWETGVGAGQLFNNFSYSDFVGYTPLATDNYVLEVRDNAGTTTVASYDAPLAELGLADSAVVVLASGFLNPANNSNGPAFGLWAALPSGGDLVELPQSKAQIQVIHNSADLAANMVDVYVNDNLALNDFTFRTATPFIEVPAGVELKVDIAPSTSTSVAQSIATFNYSLASGGKYVLVANGIVSQAGYSPATPFNIHVMTMGQTEAALSGNTDVLVFHGATDAPTVSVWETGVGAGQLFNNFSYSNFEGYTPLATADYVLEVRDNAGTTTVAAYDAPLATLGLADSALVVLASGFLNPTNNSNGPAFGLWVALPGGGNLIELPVSSTIGFEDATNLENVTIYPNPVGDEGLLRVNLMLNEASNTNIDIYDASGRVVWSKALGTIGTGLSTQQLDLNDLPQGIYHMNILSGNEMISESFAVVK